MKVAGCRCNVLELTASGEEVGLRARRRLKLVLCSSLVVVFLVMVVVPDLPKSLK